MSHTFDPFPVFAKVNTGNSFPALNTHKILLSFFLLWHLLHAFQIKGSNGYGLPVIAGISILALHPSTQKKKIHVKDNEIMVPNFDKAISAKSCDL